MFKNCKHLKGVELPDSIEHIGERCFMSSGIEEITLPCTLRDIGEEAFRDCQNLRTVWVEDGCRADFSEARVSRFAQVGPLSATMAGSIRVWDLK